MTSKVLDQVTLYRTSDGQEWSGPVTEIHVALTAGFRPRKSETLPQVEIAVVVHGEEVHD